MLKQFADKVIKDRKKFSETKGRFLKTMHSIQGEMNRDDMSKCYHKRVEVVHEHDMAQFEKRRDRTHKSIYDTERKYFDFLCENKYEIWRPVKGFPNYEVSTLGRVKVVKSNRNGKNNVGTILKHNENDGYHKVTIRNEIERKTKFVHVLVANRFIFNGQPDLKDEVDHISRTKTDNRVCNLRWLSHTENMEAYKKTIVYVGKKIYQYDLNDVLIKEWNNLREIVEANPQYKQDSLMHALAGKKSKMNKLYGYKWKYNDVAKIQIKDDEVFKNVGIFKGVDYSNFEISNYGNVRNIDRNNILAGTKKEEYRMICLYDKKTAKSKYIKVHQLVATYFIGDPPSDKHMVNHKDKNRSNNHVSNLEWVINQENIEHAHGRKIQQINKDTNAVIKEYISIQAACNDNEFKKNSHVSISQVCRGLQKVAYGYKWKYIDV
jgi:hypothetical protein